MPLKKFQNFEDAKKDLWVLNPDAEYINKVRSLFTLVNYLAPRKIKRGVYKFVNINDKNELTVIIEKSKVKKEDVINIENDWKLITFDTVLDFSLTGFISKISSALAEANISIFVVSSYSTDHILIKKENLDKTLKILRKLKMNI